MYDEIVVAFDGSEPASDAVEHALAEAEGHGAAVHVIYVIDTDRYAEPALSTSELETTAIEEWATDALEEIVERGEDRGVSVEAVCRHGTPYLEIVDFADAIDADLIVIGYKGHGQRRHGRIGSVTDRVVQQIDRPVLVV